MNVGSSILYLYKRVDFGFAHVVIAGDTGVRFLEVLPDPLDVSGPHCGDRFAHPFVLGDDVTGSGFIRLPERDTSWQIIQRVIRQTFNLKDVAGVFAFAASGFEIARA
jgi:hypothetical protein